MLGQLANVVAAAASNAEVPLQQLLQLQPQQGSSGSGGMRWVAHHPSFVSGEQPDLARSGHTAAVVGSNRSVLVVFGGLRDKKFLDDCVVLDMAKRVWMPSAAAAARPEGPGPRAFHCAAVTDSGNMFVFGGRAGKHRLADFWMLDVETWQWVELPCSGAVPPPRDFASLVAYGRFLILHGGWDGSKFLSDTYVLDTSTLEWRQVLVSGAQPAARCGHAAIIVEKRMLLFGGRGQGGSMQNDLWALKDFLSQDQLQQQDGTSSSTSTSASASATWTQLRLQGTAPSARCGHCVVAGRTQVMVHGGHSQGGWLSRVDTYLNDIVVLDRSTASWRALPVAGEAIPPPRAYHTLTRIVTEQLQHVRYVCIGGYAGSHTLADMWWLLPADDPWARRDAEMEARRKVLSQAAATVTATAALVPPAPPPTTVNRQHLPAVGAKTAAAQALAGASEGLPSLAVSEVEGQEWQQLDTKASMEGLRQRLGLASGPSASRSTDSTQWRVGGGGDGNDDGTDGSTLKLHDLGVRLLRIQRAFDAPSASGSGEGEGEGGVQRDGDVDRQTEKGREPAAAAIAAARRHLATTDPTSLCMMEVRLLFNDYCSQVTVAHLKQSDVLRATEPASTVKDAAQWRFFHLRSGHEVRMADVAPLQLEYKQLLLLNGEPLRATGA